ncbi:MULTISPECIES: YjiH family protein [Sporosarcina]|uniref:Nucleoside recognition GATE domain-containing membrane protein YjiH n=1 Tax=Sporosarcina newyorkensis TaxID=759851 RepID=A0A1T4Y190_9BACL|nr:MULTISPECIES: YjiH family protein [Sporosarcina]MBY0221527.1 YjiH family protein [Sporosarcina aquimarina]SKA95071.1 nucleoside recognition GATE domain-containing membrane protein YjiH [Sporosarcina newyorkensis]
MEQLKERATSKTNTGIWKFFVYSAIGAFMFFVPVTINGNNSIMLDHIVTWFQTNVSAVLPYYALLILIAGAAYPFISGTWKKSTVDIVFSFFKVIGLVVGILLIFNIGPAWLFEPDMGPFLLNKLVIPVGLLVPIGAAFLALLVSYGLLEFIGVLMQPVMRPLWRTPGRSAVDAVASFVGSYSLGLLITNRVYKEGKYTAKEAAIIATGFSTVSATFMVVVAKTLDIMSMWNLYFWLTLVVTFIVTGITVRIWPLASMKDEYYEGSTPQPEMKPEGSRFAAAWDEAMETVSSAPGLVKNIWINVKDGLMMAMAILPSILSIGLLGLVLAEYTPVFDWIGYIFYPFTYLMQVPEPMLVAKASALGIAEMFLPASLVVQSALISKFIVGVVSVSGIIFFSALVPCIVATEIPISIPKLVIIWIQRVILTIIIVTPLAFLLL